MNATLARTSTTAPTAAAAKTTSKASHTEATALAHAMLAAGVAAWVVLADQWMGDWGDSHALAAGVALWLVAMLAMAALRGLMRQLAQRLMRLLNDQSATWARRRADARLWEMARTDPRLMQELRMAQQRHEQGLD